MECHNLHGRDFTDRRSPIIFLLLGSRCGKLQIFWGAISYKLVGGMVQVMKIEQSAGSVLLRSVKCAWRRTVRGRGSSIFFCF